MENLKLNDNSSMMFGLHKGKPLKNVPDQYLLFMRELFLKNGTAGPYVVFNIALKAYIEENLDSIMFNAKNNKWTR